MSTKTCSKCGRDKPLELFSPDGHRPDRRGSWCKACKAAAQARRHAELSPEERAEAARAYRAGIRKDKCAVCGTTIQGHGLCITCEECVDVLGGLEGLKRAVRAVRHLTGE